MIRTRLLLRFLGGGNIVSLCFFFDHALKHKHAQRQSRHDGGSVVPRVSASSRTTSNPADTTTVQQLPKQTPHQIGLPVARQPPAGHPGEHDGCNPWRRHEHEHAAEDLGFGQSLERGGWGGGVYSFMVIF